MKNLNKLSDIELVNEHKRLKRAMWQNEIFYNSNIGEDNIGIAIDAIVEECDRRGINLQ